MNLQDRWPPDHDAPSSTAIRVTLALCVGICVGALIVEASYRYPTPVPQGPGGKYVVFEQKDGRLKPADGVRCVVTGVTP